jgi:hypothetical protein
MRREYSRDDPAARADVNKIRGIVLFSIEDGFDKRLRIRPRYQYVVIDKKFPVIKICLA